MCPCSNVHPDFAKLPFGTKFGLIQAGILQCLCSLSMWNCHVPTLLILSLMSTEDTTIRLVPRNLSGVNCITPLCNSRETGYNNNESKPQRLIMRKVHRYHNGVCQHCMTFPIAQIAPLSFQGSHRTQTQTSEVRWLHASVVTERSPACLHKQFPGDLHRGN